MCVCVCVCVVEVPLPELFIIHLMCLSAEPTHLAPLPLGHPDVDGGEVIIVP